MLGRKQSITNNDWVKAMAGIKSVITKTAVAKLEKETVAAIKEQAKDKKAAFAWSGGKDSIVLAALCKKADITACMLGVCNLEYPAFMAWVEEHKPPGLEIINTGQGLEWLAKHQEMLFPVNAQKAGRWFSIVQHTAQTKYYKAHSLEMLLVGRRKADGNFVGKNSNTYTNGKGVTYYSPLADWTHEQLLAYIAYNNLALPPIYEWHNGYKCGTHPWPARQYTGSIENAWREILSIDPTLIERAAAAGITSAIEFTEVGKNGRNQS